MEGLSSSIPLLVFLVMALAVTDVALTRPPSSPSSPPR